MKFPRIYKNVLFIIIADIIFLACALYAAYQIRFEFNVPDTFFLGFKMILPVAVFIKLLIFNHFDLYKGMWRYTGVSDLLNILKASVISTMLIVTVVVFINRFYNFSRSIFIIDWCLTFIFISGIRLCIRFYFENSENSFRDTLRSIGHLIFQKPGDEKRLLIIGAGDCGEKIYREIHNNTGLKYRIVGFLDDHPSKKGKKIHGIPVLGPVEDVKDASKIMNADELLIAIPSANAGQMRRIVEYCRESGLQFKTIPGYGELINGKVTVNLIRDVAYRDLLGREVIHLDKEKIGAYLEGQTIMITGAGGSIGSELCRQVMRFGPERVLLYDWAESPLYDIELELSKIFGEIPVVPVLADIKDKAQLCDVFERFNPRIVFHAAAYKHVPMLEMQPWKAVENNIFGTMTLLEVAEKYGVERFVFVSTDKAVRPTNIMGASKRVAEMLVQNRNSIIGSTSRFMIVRFGNVVGSVGSVIPLFKKQIAEGGPVTVTHKDVTRYFMLIPEACQLILQAGALGNGYQGADIFLLDMGTPIKIDDMARDLIRFSGFEPDVDIRIDYIGLRPGEKLYEELITNGEGVVKTSHEKIMVLKGTSCDPDNLRSRIDLLVDYAKGHDRNKIIEQLLKIVPEYVPYSS